VRTFLQILLLSCILAPVCPARADSTNLAAGADTSISEDFPDNNFGAATELPAGLNNMSFRSRELIRFDIAGQIPSNAVIKSVSLTISVVRLPGTGGVASTFDLRRVMAAWVEGTGSGQSGTGANAGEVTWNERAAGSLLWSAPGGVVSNDFSATISSSAPINGLGSYTFASTSNTVADAQAWLLNPSANFGWVLMTESEGVRGTLRRFASREDTGNVPGLLVQYVVPVAPVIQNIQAAAGQFQFSFVAQAGQPYTAQYCDSLSPGSWNTLTNVSPQPATTNVLLSDPFSTNSQRFYRIITQF